jgi:uncharacterized protein DUF2252
VGAVQRAVHDLLRPGPGGDRGDAGVLAGLEDPGLADGQASHASLCRPPVPRAEREALGKSLRDKVAVCSLGDWRPGTGRGDLVSQLDELHRGRLPHLVPIRVSRMLASPYGYLRGSAAIMAADLATLPATGIMPVICGDAHVAACLRRAVRGHRSG